MGDQVGQDTVEVMVAFMDVCGSGYERDPAGAKYVEIGYIAICGWPGGLRGNEICVADLGAIVALMPRARQERKYLHCPVVLQGKFKSHWDMQNTSSSCH